MSDYLGIRVVVRPVGPNGDVDHDRVINQYDHKDRQWLAKTAFWAMHNGRMVTSWPVEVA